MKKQVPRASGAFVGYRCWMSCDRREITAFAQGSGIQPAPIPRGLYPLNMDKAPWQVGTNTARHVANCCVPAVDNPEDPAPLHCNSCGFYAYSTMKSALRQFEVDSKYDPKADYMLFGAVAIWGKVEVGVLSEGDGLRYRSQYAKPLGLRKTEQHAKAVHEITGIPLYSAAELSMLQILFSGEI